MIDVHPIKIVYCMNLRFQMVDTDTGEILAHRYENLACNIGAPNDVGFKKIVDWAASCIRGVRTTEHKNIELRVGFCKEIAPSFLSFSE